MLQSPRIKYHIKTIVIDQLFSNSAIFEHRYLQNIKKLYKHAWKWDHQQQLKDVLEIAMVSNTKRFIDNFQISHDPTNNQENKC